MSNVLKFSEAATIALHGVTFLAANSGSLFPTREIAARFKVSEAHLSKVLQRLSKSGLVKSIRGPKGGFALGKPASEISLLDVYEAIEGPLVPSRCLFGDPICEGGKCCIMGNLLEDVDKQVRDYLFGKKLSDLEMCGYEKARRKNAEDQEDN